MVQETTAWGDRGRPAADSSPFAVNTNFFFLLQNEESAVRRPLPATTHCVALLSLKT